MRKVLSLVVPLGFMLATGVLATLLVLAWPRLDSPDGADAVVVLSGDRGERLRQGVQLVERGVAPTLVLAGDPDFREAFELCGGDRPFEVVCLRPDPDSTRSEAQAVARLARGRGWRRLAVVTAPWHAARTRMVFEGCFGQSVEVVGVSAPGFGLTPRVALREWLGMAQAFFVRC